MLLAKPITSPMASAHSLSQFEGDPFPDPTEYRSTVSALQHLSITRPNFAFSINKIFQFMYRPTNIHWSALKRILWYLKHTISNGLFFRKNSSVQLTTYSNIDWVDCPNDHRSTSGYCIFLGPNLIS